MGCVAPFRGYRSHSGTVTLGKSTNQAVDATPLAIPCGNCIGCRTTKAREWSLRCHLEAQQHSSTVFATLTYRDDALPPTLDKRHLQLWLKRLRKSLGAARAIRFFAAGEYGETTSRPHYHSLIFGGRLDDASLIEETWGLGHTRTEQCTPARIAYCAGYTAKKLDDIRWQRSGEQVDPDTGEVYQWQPPFIQMSRRPGIGGRSRQHTESWREYAILNGAKLPVPKLLHDAWKATATPEQLEQLEFTKYLRRKNKEPITLETLNAKELELHKQQEIKAARRRL